jgi:hypothetical protein
VPLPPRFDRPARGHTLPRTSAAAEANYRASTRSRSLGGRWSRSPRSSSDTAAASAWMNFASQPRTDGLGRVDYSLGSDERGDRLRVSDVPLILRAGVSQASRAPVSVATRRFLSVRITSRGTADTGIARELTPFASLSKMIAFRRSNLDRASVGDATLVFGLMDDCDPPLRLVAVRHRPIVPYPFGRPLFFPSFM